MATYSRSIRRGLPRVAGGDPWPVGADSVVEPVADAAAEVAPAPVVEVAAVPVAEATPAVAAPVITDIAPAVADVAPAVADVAPANSLRRGLPRTEGGEAWPVISGAKPAVVITASEPVAEVIEAAVVADVVAEVVAASTPAAAQVAAPAASQAGGTQLRRGLPRTVGGDGWPPAGAVAAVAIEPTPAVAAASEGAAAPVEVPAAAVVAVPVKKLDVSTPLPFTKTVFPGRYANVPVVKAEPKRYGKFTALQWAGLLVVSGGALLGAAAMAVIVVRLLMSMDFLQDFVATYPGTYDLPEGAEPGFPAWAQWQHFFNIFLMTLIIRTGLTVRRDTRPGAFWTPKRSTDGRGKISLTLWLHQALDLLWIINGIAFIVLLFASGHWMRIVPTSWEVIPNAVSAILQYISLDWPVEHGWVNYNSVQQIMYFTVVFIAAPLAVITGLRMSNLWPKNAKALNKAYPVELARALHFPTMLFFVVFIIIHVFLVFATGALRNLNHMFGGTDELNWTGFWLFFAGLCVVVVGWVAARPLVVAPIAKLFGKVSAR